MSSQQAVGYFMINVTGHQVHNACDDTTITAHAPSLHGPSLHPHTIVPHTDPSIYPSHHPPDHAQAAIGLGASHEITIPVHRSDDASLNADTNHAHVAACER